MRPGSWKNPFELLFHPSLNITIRWVIRGCKSCWKTPGIKTFWSHLKFTWKPLTFSQFSLHLFGYNREYDKISSIFCSSIEIISINWPKQQLQHIKCDKTMPRINLWWAEKSNKKFWYKSPPFHICNTQYHQRVVNKEQEIGFRRRRWKNVHTITMERTIRGRKMCWFIRFFP